MLVTQSISFYWLLIEPVWSLSSTSSSILQGVWVGEGPFMSCIWFVINWGKQLITKFTNTWMLCLDSKGFLVIKRLVKHLKVKRFGMQLVSLLTTALQGYLPQSQIMSNVRVLKCLQGEEFHINIFKNSKVQILAQTHTKLITQIYSNIFTATI